MTVRTLLGALAVTAAFALPTSGAQAGDLLREHLHRAVHDTAVLCPLAWWRDRDHHHHHAHHVHHHHPVHKHAIYARKVHKKVAHAAPMK